MPKIKTKVTYNNRAIKRLNTCAKNSITVNSHYRQDTTQISFLGFNVYIYEEGNGNYPGEYLILVDPSGEVKGVLVITTDEGIRDLDFQTP
jgi:hypothetical protein